MLRGLGNRHAKRGFTNVRWAKNLLFILCLPCFGQHEHTLTLNSVSASLSPELIPDFVAYRLFFRTMWPPQFTNSDPIDRLRSIVRDAHLAEFEVMLLPGIMGDFNSNLAQFNSRSKRTLPIETQNSSASVELDALTSSTVTQLQQSLSLNSWANLHALIMREKAHMTVFFQPDMSKASQ